MREANLPVWASAISKGKIAMDATEFYPDWLQRLGIELNDVDQYWLEVARQCAKLEVTFAVAGTNLMADSGGALVLIIEDSSKTEDGSKWAQVKFPAGKGAEAANRKDGARAHFNRVMGLNI